MRFHSSYIVQLSLAIAMIFGFTACGGDNTMAEASSEYITVGTTIDISGAASTGNSLAVQANCTWVVVSDVDWIHITSPSGGHGNGNQNIVFNADASPRPESRTGHLTITTPGGIQRTVDVVQRKGDVTLSSNLESLFFDYRGGDQTIEVTSNTQWTATSSVSWLKINGQPEVNLEGYQSIQIHANENTAGDAVKGVITLKDQDGTKIVLINVELGGKNANLKATILEGNDVPAAGGTKILNILSNFNWSASITLQPAGNWARFKSGEATLDGQAASEAQNVELTVEPNTTEQEREISIKVETTSEGGVNKTETVTITQAAGTRPTVSTPADADIEATGSSVTFKFTASTTSLEITELGAIYSTSQDDLADEKNPQGTPFKVAGNSGQVTLTVTGLTSSTTYYFRVYAMNGVGKTYSGVISATTQSAPGRDDNKVPDNPS